MFPKQKMYSADIRAPACKIQINTCLVAYLLEEVHEKEYSELLIEQVTRKVENYITHALGYGKSLPPFIDICNECLFKISTTPFETKE